MEIEIIEFYPAKPNKNPKRKNSIFIGTLHIYLPHVGLDVRGIGVFQKPGSIFFRMPYRHFIEEETKIKKTYPVIFFVKPDQSALFSRLLKSKGTEYVKKFLENMPKK